MHTQPELSCDGWTDGEIFFNLNKTKEDPQKHKRCLHAKFPGRLPLSPWGFLMFLYQKQEIVTQYKGSGLCISCIHLRMCVCVYVIGGEKRQADQARTQTAAFLNLELQN